MKIRTIPVAMVLLLLFPWAALSAGFQVLHSFGGQTAGDGSVPQCTLVSDGSRLYGTTSYGGYSDYGTVFSILPDGSDYRVLHHFGSETAPATVPTGALVSDGSDLYGTARYGGSNGQGVVFSLMTDGSGYAELHGFTAYTGDGISPIGGVTGDGTTLYGTTIWGGEQMWGTVFSLEPNVSGATVLHSFPAFAEDGEWPYAAPLLENGILYGSTLRGPEPASTPFPPGSDSGVIYSLQTDGGAYSLLYTFGSQTDDGDGPIGSLLSDGTLLYGVTAYGGADGYGTVFSLDPNASAATILHSFNTLTGDGWLPTAGLVSDGTRLYGTTTGGGAAAAGFYYGGTIFAVKPDGSDYTVLHDFSLQTGDGHWLLFSGLLLLDHTLYGTANFGGDHDYGVIFSYGLPPSPTPLATPTPSAAPTSSPTPAPSATPAPTSSPTPPPSATPAPTSSPTPAPSATPAPTSSPTPPPTSSPTPAPSTSPSPGPSPQPSPLLLVLASGDYNGDGKADIAVFRPSEGKWMVRDLGTTWYGRDGDLPVPGDYNGNGVADIGIYRPSSGLWAVKSLTRFYLAPGLIPAPADYDGDGVTDAAAFRPSEGLWTVRNVTRVWFGQASDRPVPGDYNGDGSSKIAVWRPATGLWAIRGLTRKFYGLPDDIPVPGCYAWDGTRPKAQAAVYRPARGKWLVLDGPPFYYGSLNDVPMPGSYTGEVLDIPAVFRGAKGLWFIRGLTRAWFGRSGDYPVTK